MNSAAHLIFNDQANPRNYQEDFSHENGNYACKCSTCGLDFLGHKRRTTCKVCYEKSTEIIDDLQLRKIWNLIMKPITEEELVADVFDSNKSDKINL